MLSAFADTILSLPINERRPFFFWVDEALRFTGLDTVAILKEARKFKATGVFCLQDLASLDVGSTDIARQLLNNAGTSFVFNLVAREDLDAIRTTVSLPTLSFEQRTTLKNLNCNEYVDEFRFDEIQRTEQTQRRTGEQTFKHTLAKMRSYEDKRSVSLSNEQTHRIEHESSSESIETEKRTFSHIEQQEHEVAESRRKSNSHEVRHAKEHETSRLLEQFREQSRQEAHEYTSASKSVHANESTNIVRFEQGLTKDRRNKIGIETNQSQIHKNSTNEHDETGSVDTNRNQHLDRSIRERPTDAASQQKISQHDDTLQRIKRTANSSERTDTESTSNTRRATTETSFEERQQLASQMANQQRDSTSQELAASDCATDAEREGNRLADTRLQRTRTTNSGIEALTSESMSTDKTRKSDSSAHELGTAANRKSSSRDALMSTERYTTDVSRAEIVTNRQLQEAVDSQKQSEELARVTGGIIRQERRPIVQVLTEEQGLKRSIEEQYTKGDQDIRMLDTAQIFLAQRSGPTIPIQVHNLVPPYKDFLPTVRHHIARSIKATFEHLPFIFDRYSEPETDALLQAWLSRLTFKADLGGEEGREHGDIFGH
jgi:hypothetical protein